MYIQNVVSSWHLPGTPPAPERAYSPIHVAAPPDLVPVSLELENVVHAGVLSNGSTFQQGTVFGASAALREL